MSENKTMHFASIRTAGNSPLAKQLFHIEGVKGKQIKVSIEEKFKRTNQTLFKGVFFGQDFISINKAPELEWVYLKPQVFAVVMVSENDKNDNFC